MTSKGVSRESSLLSSGNVFFVPLKDVASSHPFWKLQCSGFMNKINLNFPISFIIIELSFCSIFIELIQSGSTTLNAKGSCSEMEYKVEVDFAPIYECVTSLTAFLLKQNHNAMDSGKLWVREVQGSFTTGLLQKLRETMKETDDFTLSPYIWSCKEDRSVAGFLNWLDALSSGQLYELASRFGSSIPPNLPDLRNRTSEALREWDLRYFSKIDPAIIAGLRQEAEFRSSCLNGSNDMEVYEEATEGMRLYPNDTLKQVVIIPQYHARPLVTSSHYDEFVFTSYSCDALPPEEGKPAPALLRLTRALSDETRLYILRLLAEKQMSFTEVAGNVGLSKSTIHYHLIALRAAGLVIVHYYGKSTAYSLRLEALNDLPRQIGSYLKG